MKLTTLALMLAILPTLASAGLLITEENDVFYKKDYFYTQGAEFKWFDPISMNGDEATVMTYGIRNLIYTPRIITDPNPQPWDRPWAGLTALSVGQMKSSGGHLESIEVFAGVVGPWSGSDWIQTEFHRLINNKLPEGWDNQIPNEPVINGELVESWDLLKLNAFGSRVFGVEAGGIGDLGTAFIDGGAFGTAKLGWNVPMCRGIGVIGPKLGPPGNDNTFKWSAYVFGTGMGRGIYHNVMLGGSFWQDGPHKELEPVVWDGLWGAALEADWKSYAVSLGYTANVRTDEFKGQDEVKEWGSVRLGIGRVF